MYCPLISALGPLFFISRGPWTPFYEILESTLGQPRLPPLSVSPACLPSLSGTEWCLVALALQEDGVGMCFSAATLSCMFVCVRVLCVCVSCVSSVCISVYPVCVFSTPSLKFLHDGKLLRVVFFLFSLLF